MATFLSSKFFKAALYVNKSDLAVTLLTIGAFSTGMYVSNFFLESFCLPA